MILGFGVGFIVGVVISTLFFAWLGRRFARRHHIPSYYEHVDFDDEDHPFRWREYVH
jgi:hypothetical protein